MGSYIRVTWQHETAAWEIVLSERQFYESSTDNTLVIKAVTAPEGQEKSFYRINDKDILGGERRREEGRNRRGEEKREIVLHRSQKR